MSVTVWLITSQQVPKNAENADSVSPAKHFPRSQAAGPGPAHFPPPAETRFSHSPLPPPPSPWTRFYLFFCNLSSPNSLPGVGLHTRVYSSGDAVSPTRTGPLRRHVPALCRTLRREVTLHRKPRVIMPLETLRLANQEGRKERRKPAECSGEVAVTTGCLQV